MKNKKTAEEEIDDILGDVLDTFEEADAEPEIIVEDGKPQVNIKKFDKLMEAFDIGDGNMSKNIADAREETMKELQTLQESSVTITPEVTQSIVNTDELLQDHILVREALREDIASGRLVIQKLAEEISTTDMDQLNGQVTEAYASIKKANVMSIKLLIESYSLVSETQNKIKKLASELKSIDNKEKSEAGVNVENAIFVGSASDMIKSLSN